MKRSKENIILLKHKLLVALGEKKKLIREIEHIKQQLREEHKENMSKKQVLASRKLVEIRKSDIDIVRKLKLEKKSKEDIKTALKDAKEKRKKK